MIAASSDTIASTADQKMEVVKSKGIPESNIIVMAYDDIANNSENPFPGKLFNKPTAAGTAGVDVYAGCNIDYKGKDVTPANFQAVLTGTASGKKLGSTSDDNVFVFFSDHGAAGLIAFPTGAGELHKADLQKTFDTMHTNNMYKKLTFYLETCESGSMFEGMSTPGVYALSASGPSESSWGTYCGSDAKVDGKSIGSCLGDLFSVNWMEDSDVANFKTETVNQQVSKVTSKVKGSHVSKFGDSSTIGGEVLADFEGAEVPRGLNISLINTLDFSDSAVNSRDIEVHLAYYELQRAETIQKRKAAEAALAAVLAKRAAIDKKFMSIATVSMNGDKEKARAMVDGSVESLDADCHVRSLETVVNHCGSFNDYSLRHSRLFANLCKVSPLADIGAAVKQVCAEVVV